MGKTRSSVLGEHARSFLQWGTKSRRPCLLRPPLQESLSALFDIPLEIAVQLVIKHPALASIPPNATITKAKSMSLALGCSMQVGVTNV